MLSIMLEEKAMVLWYDIFVRIPVLPESPAPSRFELIANVS